MLRLTRLTQRGKPVRPCYLAVKFGVGFHDSARFATFLRCRVEGASVLTFPMCSSGSFLTQGAGVDVSAAVPLSSSLSPMYGRYPRSPGALRIAGNAGPHTCVRGHCFGSTCALDRYRAFGANTGCFIGVCAKPQVGVVVSARRLQLPRLPDHDSPYVAAHPSDGLCICIA